MQCIRYFKYCVLLQAGVALTEETSAFCQKHARAVAHPGALPTTVELQSFRHTWSSCTPLSPPQQPSRLEQPLASCLASLPRLLLLQDPPLLSTRRSRCRRSSCTTAAGGSARRPAWRAGRGSRTARLGAHPGRACPTPGSHPSAAHTAQPARTGAKALLQSPSLYPGGEFCTAWRVQCA